jgi:hypothetical protein
MFHKSEKKMVYKLKEKLIEEKKDWVQKIPIIDQQILSEINKQEQVRKEYRMRKKRAFKMACEFFCEDLSEICCGSLETLIKRRVNTIVVDQNSVDFLLHQQAYDIDGFLFPGHVLMYGFHLPGNKHYLARNRKTFCNYQMIKPFVRIQKAFHERAGVWLINKSDSNKSHKVILVLSVSKPVLEPPLWHALNNTYDQMYKASCLYEIPDVFKY